MADRTRARVRHERNRHFRILFGTLVAIVSLAAAAVAQPSIVASVIPSPNRLGWNNTPVTISFACTGVRACPAPVVVASEGTRQLFTQTVGDDAGRTAVVAIELSLDFTPTTISWTTPSADATTIAGSAQVTALVEDALSGVVSATCNGDSAVLQGDTVACAVPLRDGINDLVVQVLDRAGNSSSTGVQVNRVGPISRISIVPSTLTLLTGESRAVQVLDNFGRPVAGVEWFIDSPWVLSIDDARSSVTALSPGDATVTARSGTFTSSMAVGVRPGKSLPMWTTRWSIEQLPGYRTPERVELFRLARVGEDTPTTISVEHEIAGPGLMLRALDLVVPKQFWIEAPAISARESIGQQLAGDGLGTGVVRVQTRDARSSSLVRVGRPSVGTLWRYTPPGWLGQEFAIYDALVDVVETPPDGFPVLVSLDATTGSAKYRVPLPRSSLTVLNAACAGGTDVRRDFPAAVGPTPTVLDGGTINLAFSTAEISKDSLPCGTGASRSALRVHLMQLRPGSTPTYRTVHEYAPAGDGIVEIALRKVLPDGHGGQLVAWSARFGNRLPEHTVVRVNEGGLLTFQLPALGETVLAEGDMGVTCDGRTIVGFDVMTGRTLWTHYAVPGESFGLVMAVAGGGLYVDTGRGMEHIDHQGRRVLVRPSSR
jgi:hypothetical protein